MVDHGHGFGKVHLRLPSGNELSSAAEDRYQGKENAKHTQRAMQ